MGGGGHTRGPKAQGPHRGGAACGRRPARLHDSADGYTHLQLPCGGKAGVGDLEGPAHRRHNVRLLQGV